MGLLSSPPAKPGAASLAPAGAYLTDGDQLVRILESDRSGALGEDCVTENLVSIEAGQLTGPEPHWRRVHPAEDQP